MRSTIDRFYYSIGAVWFLLPLTLPTPRASQNIGVKMNWWCEGSVGEPKPRLQSKNRPSTRSTPNIWRGRLGLPTKQPHSKKNHSVPRVSRYFCGQWRKPLFKGLSIVVENLYIFCCSRKWVLALQRRSKKSPFFQAISHACYVSLVSLLMTMRIIQCSYIRYNDFSHHVMYTKNI